MTGENPSSQIMEIAAKERRIASGVRNFKSFLWIEIVAVFSHCGHLESHLAGVARFDKFAELLAKSSSITRPRCFAE